MHEITGPVNNGPAFEQSVSRRPDFEILTGSHTRGVAAILDADYASFGQWLSAFGYETVTLDLSDGLDAAVVQINRIFRWEEQFGYTLPPDDRNLDRLHDGFDFDVSPNGLALELLGAQSAWREDPRWFMGLLSIASAYSVRQLAFGRRFFTVIRISDISPPLGEPIEPYRINRYYVPKFR